MHAIMGCSTGAQLCRARIAWAHTLALAAVRLFALCQLDEVGEAGETLRSQQEISTQKEDTSPLNSVKQ